jgi:hypothetical protein
VNESLEDKLCMVVESSLRKMGLTHILDNKFHKRLRSDTLNTSSQKIAQTNHIGTNLYLIVDSANQLLCILVEAPRILARQTVCKVSEYVRRVE